MIRALSILLYFSLIASFCTFLVLYVWLERVALRTMVGRGILMFFGAFTAALIFSVVSYYTEIPGESVMGLLMYLVLNVVGWGAPTMLLSERRRARRASERSQDG